MEELFPSGNRFKCNICHKSFTTKQSLVEHEARHTGERPFECDICMKTFAVKSYLAKHKKTHNGEKPFECDICGNRFTRSSDMTRHREKHFRHKTEKLREKTEKVPKVEISTSYDKLRLFGETQCKICSEVFTSYNDLFVHEKTHAAEEKPYKCNFCEKSFSGERYLKDHKRIHT